jgi:hypothetical protein
LVDLRTLGEIATRTSMLQVASSRCERRGRYRLDTLIARHGADAGVRRRGGCCGGWVEERPVPEDRPLNQRPPTPGVVHSSDKRETML